jgi:hypothetical protein
MTRRVRLNANTHDNGTTLKQSRNITGRVTCRQRCRATPPAATNTTNVTGEIIPDWLAKNSPLRSSRVPRPVTGISKCVLLCRTVIQSCWLFQRKTGVMQASASAVISHQPGRLSSQRSSRLSSTNSQAAIRKAIIDSLDSRPSPAETPVAMTHRPRPGPRSSMRHRPYIDIPQQNRKGGSIVISRPRTVLPGVAAQSTADQNPTR